MSHPVPRRRGSAAVVTIGPTDGPERLTSLASPNKNSGLTITCGPETGIPEADFEFRSISPASTAVELSTVREPSTALPDPPILRRGSIQSFLRLEKPVLGSKSLLIRKREPHKLEPYQLNKFLTWFSPYRRLFLLCVVVNILGLALVVQQVWLYPLTHITTFVLGNMICSVLFRNEYALRLLYWVAVKLFAKWPPLRLRLAIVGLLYHIGGLHSGCGISSAMWLGLALKRHFQLRADYHSSIIVFLTFTTISVGVTCLSALPTFRQRFHNTFEFLHRFSGWFGILSTIILILLSTFWDVNKKTWDKNPNLFLKSEDFWLILAIAFLSTTPWITVARLPVDVVSPTDKMTIMRFPGGMSSGLLTRLSQGGLKEWHIFGTISEGKKASCHYVVVAVQGDFTRLLNIEKPTQLFTRRWKVCGLPYLGRMFSKGVAICTGSGIGAVGSTCIQNKNWFLVWIGANLEDCYGPELVNFLRGKIDASRRMFWDTRSPLGRPNVMEILETVYLSWEAEGNIPPRHLTCFNRVSTSQGDRAVDVVLHGAAIRKPHKRTLPEVVLFFGNPDLNKEVLRNAKMRDIPVFVCLPLKYCPVSRYHQEIHPKSCAQGSIWDV